jgi:hypothetical protein
VHAYARAHQKEQRPRHSITLTLHPLTQIQKTPRIYAEIFGPNLAAKLVYRSPLGVMHCINFCLEWGRGKHKVIPSITFSQVSPLHQILSVLPLLFTLKQTVFSSEVVQQLHPYCTRADTTWVPSSPVAMRHPPSSPIVARGRRLLLYQNAANIRLIDTLKS